MDISDLRALATVTTVIAFTGVVWWAYSSKRKSRFDEAANLPFADDEQHEKTSQDQEKKDHE
ncbi:MAG: cbb3-type cytochrome c oxidase subunit 3 [Saccharospirillum sp.]|nr:cbb3-type cytochrome c oxidase subunit 3 [Saccharospirillum sp.]